MLVGGAGMNILAGPHILADTYLMNIVADRAELVRLEEALTHRRCPTAALCAACQLLAEVRRLLAAA